MLQQSREEIFRVFQEWVDYHAPKNFDINSKKNGLLLTNYILETHDAVSITYLNEAYAALASALDHLPEAKPKTQAELASEFDAKERARIKREAAENLAGTKKFDNLNLPKASTLEAKRQADAKKATEALISRFTVNGPTPGTTDKPKTAAGLAALRAIQIKGESTGQVDWVLTLKIVGVAFHHESAAEIQRAAQREYDSWTNKDENTRRKSDETKFGVGPGNLPRY